MDQLDKVWHQLKFFQSAAGVQAYLKQCYRNLGSIESEKKSYDNCYPFLYYLEQGETYYRQAAQSPLSIQPVLLFYGFVHLLKACLLTVDPEYPSTTSVLAHGVTARKRKKQNYQFFQEEVKIQKNGLCTHVAEKLFHVHHLEGEKFRMGKLMRHVPELDRLFLFIYEESNFFPLHKSKDNNWYLPKNIEHQFHMDKKRLSEVVQSKHRTEISWIDHTEGLGIDGRNTTLSLPFRFHQIDQVYGLTDLLCPHHSLPDLLIHYLLLYNLSMIARYETEWWFDLMKTTADHTFPFIQSFLEVTSFKCPVLVLELLLQRKG